MEGFMMPEARWACGCLRTVFSTPNVGLIRSPRSRLKRETVPNAFPISTFIIGREFQ